jgi:methylase of polypeptide subunit release factors
VPTQRLVLDNRRLTTHRSLFLAEALLHHPTLLKRTEPSSLETNGSFPPILELGAGTGFLSIFLSQIGCAAVWSSDVGDEDEDGACAAAESGPDSQLAAETGYLTLDSGIRRRGPLDGLIANLELST